MKNRIKTETTGKICLALLSFVLPFCMIMIFYCINGITPFGDSSLLSGDLDRQFVNYYASFLKTVTNGDGFLYTFQKNLGGDLPGYLAYYLNDPVVFLLFLFPKEKIITGISAMFAVQLSLGGFFMYLFLSDRKRTSPVTLLFSTIYPFIGFFFGYAACTLYFSNLAILPLVCMFFIRMLNDSRDGEKKTGLSRILFCLILGLYLFMNYYLGFMMLIFLIIAYIGLMITDSGYIKSVKTLILCMTTSVLLAAFSLVPTAFSLIGEKTTADADYSFFRRFRILDFLKGFIPGWSRNDLHPMIYCSLIVVITVIFLYFSKRMSLKEKAGLSFVIAALIISMDVNTIDCVWHGFNNPVGFPWRYSYFLPVTLIFAANAYALKVTEDPKLKKLKFVFPVIFLLTIAELLINGNIMFHYINLNGSVPETVSGFYTQYSEITAPVERIKEIDQSFYRQEKDFYRTPNDPMLYDYIGITHSSSCEKAYVRHFLSRFGFCDTRLYAFYNRGSTAFADAFFGIKYLTSRFDSLEKPYEYLENCGRYHIYKNPYALPLMFDAPNELKDLSYEGVNIFEWQNSIAKCWDVPDIFHRAETDIKLINVKEETEGIYVNQFVTDENNEPEQAEIHYLVHIAEKEPLYMYFEAPENQVVEVFVNDVSYGRYFSETNHDAICAGTYDPGDTVDISLRYDEEKITVTDASFYYENSSCLEKWYEAAAPENCRLEMITPSHLKGTTVSGSDGLIVFSMPYERGWSVYVDGKKVKTLPALQTLLSVEAEKGPHSLELRYIPEGLIIGIALSLAGVVLLIVPIIIKRKNG